MVVGMAVDAAWCVKSAVESLCLSVLARGSSHEGSSVKIWRFSIPGVLSFEPSREESRDITIPSFAADVGGKTISQANDQTRGQASNQTVSQNISQTSGQTSRQYISQSSSVAKVAIPVFVL